MNIARKIKLASILCLGVCCPYIKTSYGSGAIMSRTIMSLEKEVKSLESALSHIKPKYNQLSKEHEALSKKYTNLTEKYNGLAKKHNKHLKYLYACAAVIVLLFFTNLICGVYAAGFYK